MTNKLLPQASLPYKIVRGSINERHRKVRQTVDKLYKTIYGQSKRNDLNIGHLQQAVNELLPGIHIKVKGFEYNPNFVGYNDILYSTKTNKVKALTLDTLTKDGYIKTDNLVNILHEFTHIADSLFHPKTLARAQFLEKAGLNTDKYSNFYDKYLYSVEFPEGKNDKKRIIKRLEHRIKHFLRHFRPEAKINYLQDSRYCLMTEDNAYFTQAKYAKKLNKNHEKINSGDIIKWNKDFMFKEKIELLKRMAFEIIQKERKRQPQIRLTKIKKCKKSHSK